MPTPLCKNCGTELTLHYCPAYGQKANVGRIRISQLVKDLPHTVFHVDRGLFFNIIQLFQRPGHTILDYLQGKRKPFYHPVTFLVISLLVNYLVVKLTDLHFYNEEELRHMDPLQAQAIRDYDALQ